MSTVQIRRPVTMRTFVQFPRQFPQSWFLHEPKINYIVKFDKNYYLHKFQTRKCCKMSRKHTKLMCMLMYIYARIWLADWTEDNISTLVNCHARINLFGCTKFNWQLKGKYLDCANSIKCSLNRKILVKIKQPFKNVLIRYYVLEM